MKIVMNGKALEVNDSYALRLIEQGKAVAAPPPPPKTAKGRTRPGSGKDEPENAH